MTKLNWVEKAARSIFKLYPLVNGCGTIASSRLARTIIPPTPRKVWALVGQRKCLVPLNDLVGRAVFLIGELDRKVGITVRKYVKEGDVVMDVGANYGLVTLQFANAHAGRILSFEPNPVVLGCLDQTVAANSDASITLFRCALGNEGSELTLTVPADNAGGGTLRSQGTDTGARFRVPVRRLTEILEDEGIKEVDFMKVDVEGFEPMVLEGLFAGSVRPRHILFEDHDPMNSMTIQLLKDKGYAIRALSGRNHFWINEIDEDHHEFFRQHDFLARYKGPEAIV